MHLGRAVPIDAVAASPHQYARWITVLANTPKRLKDRANVVLTANPIYPARCLKVRPASANPA